MMDIEKSNFKRCDEQLFKDLGFGKRNEKRVWEYLRDYYDGLGLDVDVYFFKHKYARFDYYVKDRNTNEIIHEYELKSRRDITIDSYNDIMFGENKKIYADKKLRINPNLKFTILWWLDKSQKLYWWDYGVDTNSNEYSIRYGRNRKETPKMCVYVKTKYMNTFEYE